MESTVMGQNCQKNENERYRGAILGLEWRSILGKDSTQLGLLETLHKWDATMVNLKIWGRSKGVELQYLREGFLMQLFVMVALKSWGGCSLSRSSITVAENITGSDEIAARKWMNAIEYLKKIVELQSFVLWNVKVVDGDRKSVV